MFNPMTLLDPLLARSMDGRDYAHRANRHNANRPGPGGINYPGRFKLIRKGSSTVYPHSSKRQQARYKRQIEAEQIGNEVQYAIREALPMMPDWRFAPSVGPGVAEQRGLI